MEILDYAAFPSIDDDRVPAADRPQAAKASQRAARSPSPSPPLTAKAEGLSYARKSRRAVDESIKEAVMHDEDRVESAMLTRAFDERRKFSTGMNDKKAVPNHAGSTAKLSVHTSFFRDTSRAVGLTAKTTPVKQKAGSGSAQAAAWRPFKSRSRN